MANVSFKRGPAANLAAAGFSAKDGVFYLTTDTHRLYVGQGDGNLVDLNRYIQYVNSVAELAGTHAVGDFAFNADGNQLLVYTGTNWMQINPDTNTDTSVTAITTPKVSSDSTGVTVSFTVQQQTADGSTLTDKPDIPVSFKISSADFATANEVAVGVKAEAVDQGAKISTKGAGSDGSGINVKGGANVKVGVSGSDVTISATDTTYTLSGSDNGITLSDGSNKDTVIVASGTKITATVADNTLTIAHAGLAKPNQTTGTPISLEEESTFNVVTAIESADGHVTGYTVSKVTVPDYENTQYNFEVSNGTSNNANIKLKGSTPGAEDNMAIVGGTDVVVTGDADSSNVNIAHKTYAAVTPSKAANATSVEDGGTFTVVDSITTNNGHVTAIQTKDVKLTAQKNYSPKSVDVNADAAGNITVDVTDSEGNKAEGSASGVLYMNVNGTKVYNQGSIEFYTKNEIDNKINGIDAMRYKGTVGGTGATVTALPASGVAVGDTYMVAVAGTYGGHETDIGDLLIATGTEVNGVITSGLAWTYVPSGDDTDTQFALEVADNVITLKNTTNDSDVGSAEIKGGNKVNVSTADGVITVSHADLKAPTASEATAITPAFGASFTVLDSITAADGHVTAYATKKVTLPTPDDTAGSIDLKGTHEIAYKDGKGESSVVLANDDYITLTDDTANDIITVGHKAYKVPLNATAASSTAKTLNASDKFTVVTSVSRDAGGHLDGFTTQEFALPADNNTTYSLSSTDKATIKLTGNDGSAPEVAILAGTAATVAGNSDGITIGHANVTNSKSSSTETMANGGKFTVVKDVTVNAQGHTTAVKTVDITLPTSTDTTGEISGAVSGVTDGAQFLISYDDTATNHSDAVLAVTSKSLKVTAGTNEISIDLEWGSF